jgi:hypothetical protein
MKPIGHGASKHTPFFVQFAFHSRINGTNITILKAGKVGTIQGPQNRFISFVPQ